MKNKKEEDKNAKGLLSLPGGGQVDGLPPAAISWSRVDI